MQPLPIDAHLPALVEALRQASSLVVSAEPGAGKTTRLPRALLDAGFADAGEILVLEPRRLAARMAAARVADELGEPVGKRIGYQVRFDEKSSRDTRVRFVTEGVLTRRLTSRPELPGVAVVVLDEFHERNLQGDLGLCLLKKLQRGARPDLKLVVMSATLDTARVAEWLDCPIHEVPGRQFSVEIEHEQERLDDPLERRVARAFRKLAAQGVDGDVLAFLPGAAEIRRARERCEQAARDAGFEIALLHGDLPAREQDRAVTPGPRPKLILSTNVAESSLTIEGVTAVIDSGLARSAGHSPWSGLSTLETRPICRASATQRAGRAGRLRPGRCLRLYSQHDHDGRPLHDTPEVQRADLCETRLAVATMGVELSTRDWLDAPGDAAWQAAGTLLAWLGALDAGGAVTALGREVSALPLHPRLGRIVVEAGRRDAHAEGCLIAALLSERDVALEARARFDEGRADVTAGPSDALDRLERFERAEADGLGPRTARREGLDLAAARAVARVRDRLLGRGRAVGPEAHDEPLLIAILTGFADRVARRRAPGSDQLRLARGGSATLSPASVVRDAELMVVLDASSRGARGAVVAHLASAIEPEWLLELYPERVGEEHSTRFDGERERVVAADAITFAGLTLDESVRHDPRGPEAEACIAQAVLERGLSAVFDTDAIEQLKRRATWARERGGELTAFDDALVARAVGDACAGKSSFAELRREALAPHLLAQLGPRAHAELSRLAPEQVTLASGRKLRVHYEPDRPPWVQSRLQDFFGSREGPRLGGEPLVLHLLAPNQRAVQVTTDLAGFWREHYPALRRQLMRRYPRHAFPEDPLAAQPPAPRPPRNRARRRG